MSKTLFDISLPILGMSCASCVSHVEGALKELPGVSHVVVNLATNKANLTYDPQQASLDDMRRAVDDVGYAISSAELTLDVRGMTCASCVAHVETALKELNGVTSAAVNLGLGTARVVYIPGLVSISAMKRAVHEVGYEAQERNEGVDALDRERNAREEEIQRQGRNLLIAGTIEIANMLGCDDQTVRNVIKGFNQIGLDILKEGSRRPRTTHAAFVSESVERLKEILHQSPRNFGKETSLWTLDLAAEVSYERGLVKEGVSGETLRATLKRFGMKWTRAKHWITSPDPDYARKKNDGNA